jgi:hypothetical protein
MNTFNVHAELPIEDDDDEFGDKESRPLFGWFLMAVALVMMAFLIGSGPEASAHSIKPSVSAPAIVPSQAVMNREPIELAFGG